MVNQLSVLNHRTNEVAFTHKLVDLTQQKGRTSTGNIVSPIPGSSGMVNGKSLPVWFQRLAGLMQSGEGEG